MKGYKWENRAIEPDMPPLDINNMSNDACFNLCILIMKGFIKDYKSAVKYGDAKIRGASKVTCRNNLDHPFYEALMDVAGTNKKAIMREVGDYGED